MRKYPGGDRRQVHYPKKVDTLSFKILWDADWLVDLKDEEG